MSGDDRLEAIIESEQEWRRKLWEKVETIEINQRDLLVTATTLKVKYGMMAGFFGSLGGILVTVVKFIIEGRQ
jgi:hypothetical protein